MTTKLEKTENGEQVVLGGDGFDETIVITDVSEAVDSFWGFYLKTNESLKFFDDFVWRQLPSTEGLNPMIKEDLKEIDRRTKERNRLLRLSKKVIDAQVAMLELSSKFRDSFGKGSEDNKV